MCGDSAQSSSVVRVMGSNRATLMATDPPYNVGFSYDGAYAGQDTKSPEDYGRWLRVVLDTSEDFLVDKSPVFVWQAMLNVQYFGSWFVDKQWRLFAACKNFIQVRPTWLQYAWDPVVCWIHSGPRKTKSHAGIRDWHLAITSNTKPTEDRRISGAHPCPRPVDTVQFIIESHTNPGDRVLDPFCGSGTAIVAAEMTGRLCCGIEVEPIYVDVSVKRWSQFTGRPAVLADDGRTFDEVAAARVVSP